MYNKMNPIENNLECPICLDDIDLESGDFLELDCCKNKGHIKCLENWIKVNKSNGKCYYCQQDNNYFNINQNNLKDNITNNINNTIIINSVESNNYIKKNFTFFFYFCIISLSLIIIFSII